jgi:hypothetical protein
MRDVFSFVKMFPIQNYGLYKISNNDDDNAKDNDEYYKI